MATKRLLSFEQVRDRVPYSKTHLYRLIHQNKFPKPISLGPHKVAFLESEVEDWMDSRVAARSRDEGLTTRQLRAKKAVHARNYKD